MSESAYLILENGRAFKGKPFGAFAETDAELVFTTSMTGYLETITDPSFYGQFVVQTFPLIGNVGIITSDFESEKAYLKGYIVRQWCRHPSNFRSEGRLDTFLKDQNIIGLEGVDTRALTRIVRECGVMNARISASPELSADEFKKLKAFQIIDPIKNVTIKKTTILPCENAKYRVVLWDMGTKKNIYAKLIERGCEVVIVPSHASAREVLDYDPDGIVLSNGPGDPSDNPSVISEIKKICGSGIPILAICMGHQLLAKAFGAKSEKLKYGHRGENQPVTNVDTQRVYITGQNHGYHILDKTLPAFARCNYVNANDGTCEGIAYDSLPVISVQFHPEASGGPLDTMFLFDRFIDFMKERKKDAAQ